MKFTLIAFLCAVMFWSPVYTAVINIYNLAGVPKVVITLDLVDADYWWHPYGSSAPTEFFVRIPKEKFDAAVQGQNYDSLEFVSSKPATFKMDKNSISEKLHLIYPPQHEEHPGNLSVKISDDTPNADKCVKAAFFQLADDHNKLRRRLSLDSTYANGSELYFYHGHPCFPDRLLGKNGIYYIFTAIPT